MEKLDLKTIYLQRALLFSVLSSRDFFVATRLSGGHQLENRHFLFVCFFFFNKEFCDAG